MPDLGISRKHTSRCMLGACCAVALLAALAAPVLAAEPVPIGTTAVPGELIVQFEPDVPGSERAAARRRAGVQAERVMLAPGQQVVSVAEEGSSSAALARLEHDPRVEYAQLNYVRQRRLRPDDPLFGDQWGLFNTGQALGDPPVTGTAGADIDALSAWDIATGTGVVIAVVDEGVAYDHPDLATNIWANPGETVDQADNGDSGSFIDDVRGWDFVDEDNDPRDFDLHGTHVAGIAGAQGDNGIGTAGVSWDAQIMPLRALDFYGGTDEDIANAFTYAADHGARVVNASLGGPDPAPAMEAAIAAAPDVLFVVAAGNAAQDNDDIPDFPCNSDLANVICVAATDQNDQLAGFSNFGGSTVDLGAPGVNVLAPILERQDLFADGFQDAASFDATWETPGSSGWNRMEDPPLQGDFAATDSPGANYAANANATLEARAPLNFQGRRGCTLRLFARLDVAEGDAFQIETSTDGTFGPGTFVAAAFFGNTGDEYIPLEIDLRADGQEVFLGFRLVSDGNGRRGDGAYIDLLDAGCAAPPDASYGCLKGTSMAAPHVAGTAALLLSFDPALTVSGLRQALLDSGDPVQSLAGKTATGRRLNARAALAAVDPDGNPPAPSDPEPDNPPAAAGFCSQPATQGPPAQPQPPPASPAPPPELIEPRTTPDTAAPRASFALLRRQRLRTVLRRGLRGRLSCNEACTARIDLVVDARTARRLRLTRGRRAVRIGRARVTLDEAGRRTVRIRLTRRARARLRRARSVPLRIRISAADPAGNRRTISRRARLRR